YRSKGVTEYEPYPGMEALLRRLKGAGVRLAVATMKPEVFTRAILAELGWSDLFDEVTGVRLDAPTPKKSDLIGLALAAASTPREDAVMIGDRTSDIDAGRAAGVATVYCRYGFGAPGEAELSGAAAIADTVEEIERLLLA
ncbi:MAG: HAD hydrolase-like protein, partial [Clostridia bacterium]|nr:HAD hydrolase-like protein [Clostridia bacterium]